MFSSTNVGRPQLEVEELSRALRQLHQRLLEHVRVGFEKLHGRVDGAGALLELALHDPLFTWLRPLAQRIASLDELESGTIDAGALDRARASVSSLLDGDGDFRDTYLAVLQADPAVVVAHAALRRLAPPASGRHAATAA